MIRDERGSTIPLLLGMVVLALLVVAGSIAAGSAFLAERDLQDVCDGAALAAVNAVDYDRLRQGQGPGTALVLGDVAPRIDAYLARDVPGRPIDTTAHLLGGRTLVLTCRERRRIAFGAVFGRGDGIVLTATAAAAAPLRG